MQEPLLGSGANILIGAGSLAAFKAFIEVSLGGFSGITSLGISSNEDREGVAAKDKVGEKLQNRALTIIKNESITFVKAAAVTAGGVALLYLGDKLGGEPLQHSFVQSLEFTPQKDRLIQLFGTTIAMSAGDSMMGLGIVNTIKAGSSLIMSLFGGAQAQAVRANEAKEGGVGAAVPAAGADDAGIKGNPKGLIGDTMWARAQRFMMKDLLELPKSVAVAALGAGLVYTGARFGGVSFQSSALEAIKGFRAVKL